MDLRADTPLVAKAHQTQHVSYSRVTAFARDWKADLQRELQTSGRGTFVPLAFVPGEAFQFDWSEDWAIIGNERTKLQVAHTKLSYSKAFIMRAYLLQTHEMLFDAHNHAFRVFGGVPRRGIYDNTYRHWCGTELSEKNGAQLWVPPGFAHGFSTLRPDCVISYKITQSLRTCTGFEPPPRKEP